MSVYGLPRFEASLKALIGPAVPDRMCSRSRYDRLQSSLTKHELRHEGVHSYVYLELRVTRHQALPWFVVLLILIPLTSITVLRKVREMLETKAE